MSRTTREQELAQEPAAFAMREYEGGLRLLDDESAGVQALDVIMAYGRDAARMANGMRKLLMQSNYVARMRVMLTPQVMSAVMCLQGSDIGFLTDRDKEGGYPVEVVRDCLISAASKGLSATGNQFNIIGGRAYVTTNGAQQILADLGVRHSEVAAIPRLGTDGRAQTHVTVEWVEGGQLQRKELDFEVRLNKGMSVDGANGKAIRKARMWLVSHVSGMTLDDADASEAMAEQQELRQAQLSAARGPLGRRRQGQLAEASGSPVVSLPASGQPEAVSPVTIAEAVPGAGASPSLSPDVVGELRRALESHGIGDVTAEEVVAFHGARGCQLNVGYCCQRIEAAARAVREWRGDPSPESGSEAAGTAEEVTA